MTPNPHPGRNWRVGIDAVGGDSRDGYRLASDDRPEPSEVDELVIDDWLHLERMDDRVWWMQVGDARIDIVIREDGKAVVNIGRGHYGEVNS